MATTKKARGDAVLKNLPDALQEELYQFLRRNTQEKALAWLKATHAVETSARALTSFWQWYPRSCVLRQAARTSDELEATLKRLPQLKISADQAAQVAQVNFEIQAAQDRDPALFASLRKGQIERERLRLEREKFEHSKKADWEKGLDALQDEIKDNPAALQHFEAMKAAIRKARS